MTTIRALAGSCWLISASSVVPARLLEQGLELGTVELLDRSVVLLHAPGPEVEVDGAHRVLDRPPERPAVLRHESPQSSSRDAVAKQLPVVRLHQLLELFRVQAGLAPDVPQLEAR